MKDLLYFGVGQGAECRKCCAGHRRWRALAGCLTRKAARRSLTAFGMTSRCSPVCGGVAPPRAVVAGAGYAYDGGIEVFEIRKTP